MSMTDEQNEICFLTLPVEIVYSSGHVCQRFNSIA